MAQGLDERTGSDQLAGLRAALDALRDQPTGLLAGGEQLTQLKEGLGWRRSCTPGWRLQAARIDAAEIAWQEHGTSTATWLADAAVNLTRREAGRLIAAGQGLLRFPLVADAAATGSVLPPQAEAITAVLDDLPDDFPADTVREAQVMLVGFAASHNSVELRRLTSHLVEILTRHRRSPRSGPARPRTPPGPTHPASDVQLRPPRLGPDQRPSLPVAEAEPFIQIIDAYAAATKRGLERLDPHTEYVTPAMRRADALLAMVHHHSQESLAPNHGGDRPRIVITLPYDKLLADCRGAGLVSTGDQIDAGTARRLLCDADLMPAILGGPSEVLDVGRTQRLVTPAIRAALELREVVVCSPAAPHQQGTAKPTTSSPGDSAALPPCRTSSCSAPTTTAPSNPAPTPTPTAGRSASEKTTARNPPATARRPQPKPRLHARFHTRGNPDEDP